MALENLYLILHKVRGEPTFDIASPMDVPGHDEIWWIIPTSGHRAYPYQTWSMANIWVGRQFVPTPIEVPPEWPDHYPVNKNPIPFSEKPSTPRRTLGVDALEDMLK